MEKSQADARNDAHNECPLPRYYGGWGSYRIPFVPQEPIRKDEAEKRKCYYIGFFDSMKRLVRFEKFLDGVMEWSDEYEYWETGKLRMRKMKKIDGSISEQHFDLRGKIVLNSPK